MIINDKALVRLMKYAQKNGGYRIAMTKGDPEWIYIAGPDWYVGAQLDKLPPKVLGELVTQLKGLLHPGQACQIFKKTIQDEYFDSVTIPIFELDEARKTMQKNDQVRVTPTPMDWRDRRVCRREDGEILLLNPLILDVVDRFTWAALQVGEWVIYDAGEEQVYIMPEEPLSCDVDFIEKIAALWAAHEEE